MLINSSNLVFVGQRIKGIGDNNAWQMPQGGIDKNETPFQAAMRELKEEIGTNRVEVISTINKWLYYDLPKPLRKNFWDGKFKGQQQIWYLMKLIGDDNLININTQDPEFKAWKWVEPFVLPDLIVPFKRNLYKEVIKEFTPFLK